MTMRWRAMIVNEIGATLKQQNILQCWEYEIHKAMAKREKFTFYLYSFYIYFIMQEYAQI